MAPEERQRLLRIRNRVLPVGHRTYVMAILNLTDDSFSGDGIGDDLDLAAVRAAAAVRDGADIIDIGAESARADKGTRDEATEASLVRDAVARVCSTTDVPISVDTYKALVAEAALDAGASIINDIGGLVFDRRIAEVVAAAGASLVINYTSERPKHRPSRPPVYVDLIEDHLTFLRERIVEATAAGVSGDSLIVDPGIAFGKSHDEDIQVLRQLPQFRSLGHPVMIAASRKHFIGTITGLPPSQRDEATVTVTALAIAGGTDIVRVHNVPANVRSARIADAIVRGKAGDYAPDDLSLPWCATAMPLLGTTIEEER